MTILRSLPPAAQEGIIESLSPDEQRHYNVRPHMLAGVPAGQRPSPAPRERIQGDLGVAQIPPTQWRPPEQGQGGGV